MFGKNKNKDKVIVVMGTKYALTIMVDKDYNLVSDKVTFQKLKGVGAQIVAEYPVDNVTSIVYEEPKLFKKGYVMTVLNIEGEIAPLIEFKDKKEIENIKLVKDILGK